MKNNRITVYILGLAVLAIAGCTARSASPESAITLQAPAEAQFKSYWYQGKAELSRYELQQARYGEVHTGNAVLVFVTEDFLTETQVKYEASTSEKVTPILKLNFVKKFNTGIYDYSMMTSTFSSTDLKSYPHALKVTGSSQEWCGHTYTQFNHRGDQFAVEGHSYFQKEADQKLTIPVTWLEDELWSLIRLDPSALPKGEISVIPGTMYTRLMHQPFAAQSASASLTGFSGDDYPGENLMAYTLDFAAQKRKLTIVFEGEFPHRIAGWEESYTSGWGDGAKRLSSKAIRTHQLMEPYWGQNSNSDEKMREQLGL